MNKNWKILQPDMQSVRSVCESLKCSPILAAILVNRHILSQEDASYFFSDSLQMLKPPFSIKDMDPAVRRIHTAIMKNESILIFGDYDVDGITATIILLEFLQKTGANVSYHIPHRVKEGYSLRPCHISDYGLADRADLIITADCGSTSHEAVEMAREAGTDVIITDHHSISDLPRAVAVVNPKRPDCTAGFEHLAGVGVAFCLLICLRKHLRDKKFWQSRPEPNLKQLCSLVALGTVADVVPLVDQNRILTKTGLEVIKTGDRPGIRALIKACGISSNTADTEAILFRLAPRLNAAGRMDHAKIAVDLLTTNDSETARGIAGSLNLMNQKRQSIEKKMVQDILEYVDHHPDLCRGVSLVLSDPEWHEGVLGIVASKIVEKYFRPTILISTKTGIGKGSGRSIPGIDLHAGLSVCADDMEYFGGHAMAAGLTIKRDNIPLFQKNFEQAIRKMTTPSDFVQTVSVDYELDLNDISNDLIDELETLEPYGEGNPEPLFLARNVRASSPKIVGDGNHRQMTLRQVSENRTGKGIKAIQFNIDPDMPLKDHFSQIAFRLRWNRWNGRKIAQITIVEEL